MIKNLFYEFLGVLYNIYRERIILFIFILFAIVLSIPLLKINPVEYTCITKYIPSSSKTKIDLNTIRTGYLENMKIINVYNPEVYNLIIDDKYFLESILNYNYEGKNIEQYLKSNIKRSLKNKLFSFPFAISKLIKKDDNIISNTKNSLDEKPLREKEIHKLLRRRIECIVDKDYGFFTIKVKMQEEKLAYYISDIIHNLIEIRINNYHKSQLFARIHKDSFYYVFRSPKQPKLTRNNQI